MLLDVIIYPGFLEFFKFDKFFSMKQIDSFCVSTLLVLGFVNSCSQPIARSDNSKAEQSTDTVAKAEVDHLPDTTDITTLFTLSDAEKILGEPAHLADSGSTAPGVTSKHSVNDSVLPIKRMASSYRCAYEANSVDKKTGKKGIVYFLIEQYPQVSSATTVYSYYRRSNENHPGFKELHDLGDEGWFANSPLFVYVRKGNKIFVMKVNKMTSMTSLDGFNLVIKQIAAAFSTLLSVVFFFFPALVRVR